LGGVFNKRSAIRRVVSSNGGFFAMAPIKIFDFDPRNLPQDLLAAIGLATASAAQTESFIQEAIGGCLEIDVEYAAAVTTHMNAPLRDSVLRSVAEIRIDDLDDLDELDRLLDQINVAFSKRNGLAHHTWCRDPDDGRVFTVKQTSRTRLEMDLIEMTVNHVKSDALFIYNAGVDLQKFLSTRGLLPTFPPERPRGHKSKAARAARRKAGLNR
jgi:hypothetical protein